MSQPEGFREITVVVSDAEYERFRSQRALTGPGTLSAAVRRWAGLPEEPYGIKAARQRQLDELRGDQ